MSKKTFRKFFAITPLALGIATLFASHFAHAQYINSVPVSSNTADMTPYETNNVEFGLGYQNASGNDYRANEWGGMSEHGFAIGNLNYSSQKQDGENLTIRGRNIGLDSRKFSIEGGQQGDWKLGLQFNQIMHRNTEGKFLHQGLGSDYLTLPDGFLGYNGHPNATGNPAKIEPYLYNYGVKTDRQTLDLGGAYELNNAWSIHTNYRYDHRKGSNLIGAIMGAGANNVNVMLLPYPVNDKTHQIDLGLSFATNKAQFNVGYYYSRYLNDNETLTWKNPSNLGAAVGSNFANGGVGRLDLAPDNYFQQIKADGGYNFTPKTRVTAAFQYGQARQNQKFSSYSAAPGFIESTPMPAQSLNGKVNTTMFNVVLNTREINRLNLKLKYNYNEEKNKTPRNWYLYAVGDVNQQSGPTGVPPGTSANSNERRNPIFDKTEHSFLADADYQILRRNSLRGWYQHTITSRSPDEEMARRNLRTNEYGLEWRTRSFDIATGKLQYVYEQRRGGSYDSRRSYDRTRPTGMNPNGTTSYANLRQFNIADYNQNKVRASIDIAPNDQLSVQLSTEWSKRKYNSSDCGGDISKQITPTVDDVCLGLQSSNRQSYTVDAQYSLPSNVSLFGFYTFTMHKTDQNGRANATLPDRVYSHNIKNHDDTIGFGLNWNPRAKPYELGLQYVYNRGTSKTDTSYDLQSVDQLPDIKYLSHNFDVYGKWKFRENLAMRINYSYQKLSATDWAYDDIDPWSLNNVLTTGQGSGSYKRHAVGLAMIYNW